jgi:hypothetical protein
MQTMNKVNTTVTPIKLQRPSGGSVNNELPDAFSRILLQKKGHEKKESNEIEPSSEEGVAQDITYDLGKIDKNTDRQEEQKEDFGDNFSGLASYINRPDTDMPVVIAETTSQPRVECIDKIYNDLLNISLSGGTLDEKNWEFTYVESSTLKYEVLVKKTDANTLYVQLTGFNTTSIETKYMLSELQKKLSKKLDSMKIQTDDESAIAMRVILNK